jgi:hypothetical protein
VAGDLFEEWVSGRRSTPWYWREALGAIAYQVATDLRAHWVIVGRGIVLGLVLLTAWAWINAFVNVHSQAWLNRHPHGVIFLQYQGGYLMNVATWFVGTLVTGWVVARLHRRHEGATVLGLLLVVLGLALGNERFVFLIRNSLTHERFLPYLALYAFTHSMGLLGLLLGAVVHRRVAEECPPAHDSPAAEGFTRDAR